MNALTPGTYNPVGLVDQGLAIAAYHSASTRVKADIVKEANELRADIVRAYDQSEGLKHPEKITGFGSGDEAMAGIMAAHSKFTGLKQAIDEADKKEADAEAKAMELERIALARSGGHRNFAADMLKAASVHGMQSYNDMYDRRFKHSHELTLGKLLFPDVLGAVTFPATEVVAPGITPDVARKIPTVYQAIRKVPIGPNAHYYYEETTFTNQAAARAAGAGLPESTFAVSRQQATLQVVGHHVSVPEETLEDNTMTEAYLNEVMPFGVMEKFDEQIMAGTGVGNQLRGFRNIAGRQDHDLGAATNFSADQISKMIQAFNAFKLGTNLQAEPTIVIMHPTPYGQMVADTPNNVGFQFGDITQNFIPRLLGMPVVLNMNLEAGTAANHVIAVMADFARGMYIYLAEQGGVQTQWGMSGDDFKNLQSTVRSYQRAALVVRQAEAVMTIKI